MTEQEAFLEEVTRIMHLELDLAVAGHFWQARGEYEAERVKKLVEALLKISKHRSTTCYAPSDVALVAIEALREHQGESKHE